VSENEREGDGERHSRCIEGSAFARRAAFNPVADSGLGIWTLGCALKRGRERERERKGGRRTVRRGNETDKRERHTGSGSSRATNQFALSL